MLYLECYHLLKMKSEMEVFTFFHKSVKSWLSICYYRTLCIFRVLFLWGHALAEEGFFQELEGQGVRHLGEQRPEERLYFLLRWG